MSQPGYRCPFCQSRKPALEKRQRTPLGTLVQILTGAGGVALIFWLVNNLGSVEVIGGTRRWVPAADGVMIAVVVAGVLLTWGAVALLGRLLSQRRQVCPSCKMRLGS